MSEENKKTLREVMESFYQEKLGDKGYPNKPLSNPVEAIELLPDLYRLLEEKELLPQGINFSIFQKIAIEEFKKAHIFSQLKNANFF